MSARALAVAWIDLRILLREPASVIVMAVAPLVFVPFFVPGISAQLRALGYSGVDGAQYAVPSLAVLFSLLTAQQVVTAFFRDRTWGTWRRLRAAPISVSGILAGKSLTALLVQALQLALVLGGGALLYGFRPGGGIVGILLIAFVFVVTMVSFALVAVALSRTLEQALTITAIGAIVMAGIGGALGPVAALPGWLQAVAPFSPAYWALDGIRALVLDGATTLDVLPQVIAGAGFAVLFTTVAVITLAISTRRGRV